MWEREGARERVCKRVRAIERACVTLSIDQKGENVHRDEGNQGSSEGFCGGGGTQTTVTRLKKSQPGTQVSDQRMIVLTLNQRC